MFHGASRISQCLCGTALCAVLAGCSSSDTQSTTTTTAGNSGALAGAGTGGAAAGGADVGAGGAVHSGVGGAEPSDAGSGGEIASGGATLHDGGVNVDQPTTDDAGELMILDATAADAASCDVGCAPLNQGQIGGCASDEVEWMCEGNHDLAAFNANCETVPVNSIRYCCPESFLAQCQ